MFNKTLDEVKKVNETDMFDFFELIFGDDKHKSYEEWVFSLNWMRAIPLKWLKRSWFHEELFWQEDPHCAGYYVDDNPDCDLRPKELELLTYTPKQCLDGTLENCDRLISYTRLSIRTHSQEAAMLQFLTTIFTCFIMGAGAIMFANDT